MSAKIYPNYLLHSNIMCLVWSLSYVFYHVEHFELPCCQNVLHTNLTYWHRDKLYFTSLLIILWKLKPLLWELRNTPPAVPLLSTEPSTWSKKYYVAVFVDLFKSKSKAHWKQQNWIFVRSDDCCCQSSDQRYQSNKAKLKMLISIQL